jgi:Ca-activated chloride channel family protein
VSPLFVQTGGEAALSWLRPEVAWAPALALVVLGIGGLGLMARRRERERLVHAAQLARFLPGFSRARAAARVSLASGGVLLLGVALIGPVRGYVLREVSMQGLDLVVCIDTSRSMLARDVRPDRLERAKREVTGLLDVMGADRAGLIAFSGDAREIAPLTHDRSALKKLLERVSPDDNRLGGTSVAAALERGLEMLDGAGDADRVAGDGRAIVLVTDGEDLAGKGLAVARTASARGVRVFVVGVGTVDGGKIPVRDESGAEFFLTDAAGAEVVTRMDRDSLRRLAEETGGAFLAVDENATPLETLYTKRIAQLEGRELVGGKERIPQDRYQWPLAAALLCMLGEAGLRERRRLRR